MEVKSLKLKASTKYPDWITNGIPRTKSIYKRYIWSWDILRRMIKASKSQLYTGELNILGNFKQVGAALFKNITGDHPEDYDASYMYGPDDYEDPKPYKSTYSKEEEHFLVWFEHEGPPLKNKKISRTPEATFEKLWPKIIKIWGSLREQETNRIKWVRFIEKISGRSSPRLTFKEQVLMRKARVPDFVWNFIKGTPKTKLDFSNSFSINPATDFYEYPRLPSGGRIAQTMPETLLVNFYLRSKEGFLMNWFPVPKIMTFIKKFIGFNGVKKWFKTGTVYRIGTVKDWSPAALSFNGIKAFIDMMNTPNYPITIQYGVAKYFDALGYFSYLGKELGYVLKEDLEEEVWVNKIAVKGEIVIYGYDSLKGYIGKDGEKITAQRKIMAKKVSNKILEEIFAYQPASKEFRAALTYAVKHYDAKPMGEFIANMKTGSCFKNARVWARRNNADVYTGFLLVRDEIYTYKGGKQKKTYKWSAGKHVWPVKDGRVIEVTDIGGGPEIKRLYVGMRVPDKDLVHSDNYFFPRLSGLLNYFKTVGAYEVTAIVKPCKKNDAKPGRKWCIYKDDSMGRILKTQPKGWPKTYTSKEKAQRGLKMMKTFGGFMFKITAEEKRLLLKRRANGATHLDYVAKWLIEKYGRSIPKGIVKEALKRNMLGTDRFFELIVPILNNLGAEVVEKNKKSDDGDWERFKKGTL